MTTSALIGLAPAFIMSAASQNPMASNSLMVFVLALMAFQGLVGIACIVAGVWGPVSRLLGAKPRA
jgi:hypothetical protein